MSDKPSGKIKAGTAVVTSRPSRPLGTLEPISYEWLQNNGFHRLERIDRQPYDHMRRCLGMETIGKKFMSADEDLNLDLSPSDSDGTKWLCWITKAASRQLHPTHWIHTRTMIYAVEVVFLYEGLTGRRFGPKEWDHRKLGLPMFPSEGGESIDRNHTADRQRV